MKIELNGELYNKLINFKKIFDVVVEKKLDFDNYVNTVISIGLDKMLRDCIPKEQEWNTIRAMCKKDSNFVYDLIGEIWKNGNQKQIKKKFSYIG